MQLVKMWEKLISWYQGLDSLLVDRLIYIGPIAAVLKYKSIYDVEPKS